jgi:hypothetical protein
MNSEDYVPNYDVSRKTLLRIEWPPRPKPNIITRHISPEILPPWVKPRKISEWVDFPAEVHRYWSNKVIQSDREDLIANSNVIHFEHASRLSGHGFDLGIFGLPFKYLTQATQGLFKDQPLPSDKHSHIQSFQHNLGFVGDPEYVFVQFDDIQEQRRCDRERPLHSAPLQFEQSKVRVTAVVIAKNPHDVTPRGILCLLNGKLLIILDSLHERHRSCRG